MNRSCNNTEAQGSPAQGNPVADAAALARAHFFKLVELAGGVDPAAAAIGCNRSTVSRMATGSLPITVASAAALQRFTRSYPFAGLMAAPDQDDRMPGKSISDLTAQSVLAAAGAHSALVEAVSEAGPAGAGISAAEFERISVALDGLEEVIQNIRAKVSDVAEANA